MIERNTKPKRTNGIDRTEVCVLLEGSRICTGPAESHRHDLRDLPSDRHPRFDSDLLDVVDRFGLQTSMSS